MHTVAHVDVFFIAVNMLWAAQAMGESILPIEGSASSSNAILPKLDNRLLLTATQDSHHPTTISNALAPYFQETQLVVASHVPAAEVYRIDHSGRPEAPHDSREAFDKIRKLVKQHIRWVYAKEKDRRWCWHDSKHDWDLERFVEKFMRYWPGSAGR